VLRTILPFVLQLLSSTSTIKCSRGALADDSNTSHTIEVHSTTDSTSLDLLDHTTATADVGINTAVVAAAGLTAPMQQSHRFALYLLNQVFHAIAAQNNAQASSEGALQTMHWHTPGHQW
jgi:hypothetical protein